jgi:hypothetical protein
MANVREMRKEGGISIVMVEFDVTERQENILQARAYERRKYQLVKGRVVKNKFFQIAKIGCFPNASFWICSGHLENSVKK